MDDRTLRHFAVTRAIQYQLSAVKLVYLGKPWLCRVGQARYWNLMIPRSRDSFSLLRIGNLPSAIECNGCSVCRTQRRGKSRRKKKDGDGVFKQTVDFHISTSSLCWCSVRTYLRPCCGGRY